MNAWHAPYDSARAARRFAAGVVFVLCCTRAACADDAKSAAAASPEPLQFGGEVRLKYERYENRGWDPRTGREGYLLRRVLLHGAYAGERAGAYVQFEHSAQTGGRRPADATALDDFAVTDLYVEAALGRRDARTTSPRLRAGRFELAYGAGRMLDNRYGLNTLQPFDGVLLRVTGRGWVTDAFAVRPVTVAPGAFDDLPDRGRALLGVYASRRAGRDTLEAYALRDERRSAFAYRGAAPESRMTLGSRFVVQRGELRSDTDLAWQTGSFGSAAIAAVGVENFTSYTWHAGAVTWLAGVGGGLGTGDRDPHAARLTAFRPPYPTGVTFGIVQAEGATNVDGFALQQQYAVGRFSLSTKEYVAYRASHADGLYGPPGSPLRAPLRSRAAPIGALAYATATYAPSRRVSFSGAYARYDTGAFLRESGPAPGIRSADAIYTTLSALYRW